MSLRDELKQYARDELGFNKDCMVFVFSVKEDAIMLEYNIPASDFYLDDKNNRCIFIGNSEDAPHGPRIKVSKPNKKVTRKKSSCISLHVTDEKTGEVVAIGDKKALSMDNKELEMYKDFVRRNWPLIKLTWNTSYKLDSIEKSIKHDEKCRHDNIKFERFENGDVITDEIEKDAYGRSITRKVKRDINGNPKPR